jgi:RNA polymerase sigma-70 factor (ECF subfamily)
MTEEDREERSRRRARWMAEAQGGDGEAYRALLDDIGPLVMTVVRRHARNDVEDLYQEVFMALHSTRHTYDPSRPLEPWLLAIARHVIADHEQRRRRRAARELLVGEPPPVPVEHDGHARRQLEQLVGRLSPGQREAVELLRVDGLSVTSAALRAGTSAGALKVRAHRAYKVLRQLL